MTLGVLGVYTTLGICTLGVQAVFSHARFVDAYGNGVGGCLFDLVGIWVGVVATRAGMAQAGDGPGADDEEGAGA